ncbi:THAP domain-containing protein 4 [Trichonephila clavipes]|nr:THAP domain-containing protein 4 [Trichonephila clavipes]
MSSPRKSKLGTMCSAVGCSMRSGTNLLSAVKMYRFPTNPSRRLQWEAALQRKNWKANPKSALCNKHFITEIENEPPILKLDTKEVDCQTDLTFQEISEMEKKLHALETNFVNITHKHSQNEIFTNAKAFNFYTKIQNVTFFTVLLNLVLSGWKPLTNTSLEYSEQLLLVFMKLRLGLLHEDLAFRLKISKSAASSIFKEWVRRLAEVLKKYIRVPSKQQYRRRVPAKFLKENWSRVTALIDCSEIFIDRAFNLDGRALTFSQYKSHNTVKFLIACTPLGKVPFVSKLYGGRTSDKQIIQLSGFLEQIRPGDVIFADRGFPVKDLVAERGASLVLPASTKGKKQLSSAEVINSRKVSRLRVHIERCIGRLKTFRILKSLWPISFVNNKTSEETCIGDDVIFVVAALCNILKGRLIGQM